MRFRILGASAAVILALSGCTREAIFRIGVQDETSQALMAEMVSETLRGHGGRTVLVDCGGLRACVQELRSGALDLLPAYSGDAVALVRGREKSGMTDLEQARAAYSLLDLLVTRGLGFETSYAVVMRRERARGAEIEDISDLAALQGGARIAVPEDYASRPGDGLYALSRRYGFALAPGGPKVIADPPERVSAVLTGGADAAVIRDFEYDLATLGLVRLEDGLGFYPRYQGVVLVGPTASASIATLQGALSPLVGRVQTADMRRLMQEVLVQGWMPAQAARRMLVEKGLAREVRAGIRRPPVVLAVDPRDDLGAQQEYASRVVSQAIPERPVEVLRTRAPFSALAKGRAEIALVDAARFFLAGGGEPLGARDDRAEAAAVLGERRLYLLRASPDDAAPADPLSGRVGVQRLGSSGERVASAILEGLGRRPQMRAALEDLVRALAEGRIDAALALGSSTSVAIGQALLDGIAHLESLAPHVAEVPFFLADARIPAGTFPGQDQPIDTFSMQLLLAGAAPPPGYGLRSGGPASAIPTAGQPLSLEEAEALARASATAERPDPVLQSVWERASRGADPGRSLGADALDTALNLGVFAFVFWLVVILIRRERIRPAERIPRE